MAKLNEEEDFESAVESREAEEDVSISVDDDDDEEESSDEDEEEEDDDEEEAPKTRAGKKKQRGEIYKALQEETRRRAELETEMRIMRENAMRAQQQAYFQQQQAQQPDLGAQFNEVAENQVTLEKDYTRIMQTAKTAEEAEEIHARYRAQYDRLESEKFRIRAIAMEQQRQPAPDPNIQAAWVMVKFNNQDVYSHPRGAAYVDAIARKLVTAEGRPNNLETVLEAVQRARHELKLGGKGATPTKREKQAYVGVTSSGKAPDGPKVVVMTKENRKMATALYPDLPEKAAYRRWAKNVGSKVK